MSTFIEDKKAEAIHSESVSSVEETSDYSEEVAQQGALIVEEERQLGLWATAKLHKRALLVSSVSFTAAMLYGYDSVANGASISMPAFFLYFGSIGPKGPYLPSIWTSLWGAMSALMQAIGAFVIGFVTDRFGRKWPACACSALTIIGTAMQFTATSRGLLLGGKMVSGFGIGAAMAVATTYASEVAPLRLRAPIQQGLVIFSLFMLGFGLAIIRIFVPDIRESAFRKVFALQWIVGAIAITAFALTPESPNYLITKGKLDQAHKAMAKIYGKDKSIDARLAFLIKQIREEQATQALETGSYIDCFKGVELKRTLTVMFVFMANNVGGAAFLAQSIYFLIIAGLPAIHAFDVGIGGFGLSILIIVGSWSLEGKFRRRDAFIAGAIINFLFMVAIAALYYAPGVGPLWGIAVLMNVLIGLQSSLLQGMGYPIAAEISSLKLRAKTLSLGYLAQTTSSWLTGFVTPYMYNVDAGNLGARTGFIYAAFSLLLLAGAWFWLPETNGLTVDEIDKAYVERVPPRKFQNIPRRHETMVEA